MSEKCYHCGSVCETDRFQSNNLNFCCKGCLTVFEIFSDNGLTSYYEMEKAAGARPTEDIGKFHFLDNPQIAEKLLEFQDDTLSMVNFYVPHIHCSSCIWVLENLHKLSKGVKSATVNFPEKTVRVAFNHHQTDLKSLVLLLGAIGYEPYISMDQAERKNKVRNRSLFYKLGIAGFAFGNVMLLSFPSYFEWDEFWLNQYKPFFHWIMFLMSVPVIFYAASDYFTSAWKGIKRGLLTIDVPIALGLIVLFLRSIYEVVTSTGPGFFDSLTGLVFFLLLGRYFQQKTYDFLSFERDYKSYFPIGVTRIDQQGKEESIEVYRIAEGDLLLIRNEELLPVDGVLESGAALVDYSFVTGESNPVQRLAGERLYAGGRQKGEAIEIRALSSVSQSYLTELWSREVFHQDKTLAFEGITDQVSRYFTPFILLLATGAGLWWSIKSTAIAVEVFTAVLIIACPCALALSAPFTFGNLLRWFGRKGLYLKNAQVLERMARINAVVFDKTGTLTAAAAREVEYEGEPLDADEQELLRSTLRNSNHPLSRQLYEVLKEFDIQPLDYFEERKGEGLLGRREGREMRLGSGVFVGVEERSDFRKTRVHLKSEKGYRGHFTFHARYREGVSSLFQRLNRDYELSILSGDNSGERDNLEKLLPSGVKMFFDQSPADKMEYVSFHQQQGQKVMMVGDGLNDAGALQQSQVGVAVSENVNVFSPACDAIMEAGKLHKLDRYLKASSQGVTVVKWSFALSFLYNAVGLFFALRGELSPVVAAVLMPLSSISVVAFTTLATNYLGKKL